ncbi:MAG: transporter substrate-binding domain-containing protein [Ruminococcus sp.]
MKKVLSIVLVAVMVCSMAFAMSACGGNTGTSSSSQDSASSENVKTVASVDDLEGAKIGVQLGTTGDIYASDYEEKGSTIERFSKGADAVLALSQGKVDCVIIDNEPAKAFVAANKGLKILDEPFAEEEYAICVAKNNDQLTKDINKALKELKDDGTVQKIIDNYIGDDTKGKSPYETPEGTDTSKGELHMATNAFFEPYEYYEGDKIVGIDAMMAQAICDKLGYKLVIDDMEFDAIITAVQSGKADFGMAGMTVTDERLEAINFTDSYTTATQVIIVKE